MAWKRSLQSNHDLLVLRPINYPNVKSSSAFARWYHRDIGIPEKHIRSRQPSFDYERTALLPFSSPWNALQPIWHSAWLHNLITSLIPHHQTAHCITLDTFRNVDVGISLASVARAVAGAHDMEDCHGSGCGEQNPS
jgi:hypothetical protein